MSPKEVAALVNGAIPFFGGIYATMLAYRFLGKQPGQSPQFDEWHRKYGGMLTSRNRQTGRSG